MSPESRRILILGGTGHTGRLLAGHLLAASDARVTLASRYPERAVDVAVELSHRFGEGRVSQVRADASDAASLRSAFRGHDMVVVAAPTTAHAGTVIRSALSEGVDYLDVQLSAAKSSLLRSLAGEIAGAGRCFITEAGFHPGLPAALVRHAAAQMDRIDSAVTVAYLNMGKDLPYTEAVDEVAEIFRDYRGQVFRQGAWTKPSSYHVRTLDLGDDLGRRRCFSLFLEELGPLPEAFPSLRETGFYMSETHWVTDRLIAPLVWIGAKLTPRAVRPMGRLLWWSMGTFHRPPYRVEVQVHAAGAKDGVPVRIRTSVAHSDGYELTAIPVAAALLQYLDGTARRPGLWMMGHLVDPERLLRDMAALGVRMEPPTPRR